MWIKRVVLKTVFMVLMATPTVGLADQNPSTDDVPRVMPYRGYLDLNGTPVTSTGPGMHMRFSLYDGQPGTLVYQEDQQVQVFAGRFSVVLGPVGSSNEDLATVLAAADDLYLGITLLQDPAVDTDDIVLSGRQRITPVPYAFWSATATDLKVAGSLEVAGTATANNFIGDSLEVAGTATASKFIGELACPDGWISVAGGRICFNPNVQSPSYMHAAISTCRGLDARVCTYLDMQQVCESYPGAFSGVQNGWYGDHGSVDDSFLTWNNADCTPNADGDTINSNSQSLSFFCCK